MKEVDAHFDDIRKRLDDAYKVAKRDGDERSMGAVVGIGAKMCSHSSETGHCLGKIMPLLDFGSTRHLALVALTIVTHHGGTEAREAIAQHNRTLVKLVQEHRDDRGSPSWRSISWAMRRK
ncbi:hypothetical protein C8Q76DRAFT_854088 [Earliella scabrosa]|nr:hypothetical protein C8Q76DRAFT_854088 [Earliella scabrosa]